jgi:hypothetical protein
MKLRFWHIAALSQYGGMSGADESRHASVGEAFGL